jgi:hypothetical protein
MQRLGAQAVILREPSDRRIYILRGAQPDKIDFPRSLNLELFQVNEKYGLSNLMEPGQKKILFCLTSEYEV